MLTHEQLSRVQKECDIELKMPPDTAEAIEDCVDRFYRRSIRVILDPAPADDNELVSTKHVTVLDRIACVLNVLLVEQSLPGLLLGFYVPDLDVIMLHTPLRAQVRQITLAHEEAHVARPHAGHDEVWYMALALMVPRAVAMTADHIGEGAVMQVCPWPVPHWVLVKRVAMLRALLGQQN